MNYQFIDKEFAGMMFTPAKVQEGQDIFKVFPALKKYKAFRRAPGEGLDNNKVMLWIMCVYDKNTPYRIKYKDILKRKIEAAHDIGFETQPTGIFNDAVEDFMKGKNGIVNSKIVEFVRMHKSFKYTYFTGMENSYYNILIEVMEGKTKRMAELKEIGEELESTFLEMLNEDNNPYLKEAVLRYMEEERLMLRPEDIALKLSKGEEPVSPKEIR